MEHCQAQEKPVFILVKLTCVQEHPEPRLRRVVVDFRECSEGRLEALELLERLASGDDITLLFEVRDDLLRCFPQNLNQCGLRLEEHSAALTSVLALLEVVFISVIHVIIREVHRGCARL